MPLPPVALAHTITIAMFSRPFAETRSSSAPPNKVIDETLRETTGGVSLLTSPEQAADTEQAWFWNDAWIAGEIEAQADIDAGRGIFSANSDAFLESL